MANVESSQFFIIRVKGNNQADTLAGKATLTSDLLLERSEV